MIAPRDMSSADLEAVAAFSHEFADCPDPELRERLARIAARARELADEELALRRGAR